MFRLMLGVLNLLVRVGLAFLFVFSLAIWISGSMEGYMTLKHFESHGSVTTFGLFPLLIKDIGFLLFYIFLWFWFGLPSRWWKSLWQVAGIGVVIFITPELITWFLRPVMIRANGFRLCIEMVGMFFITLGSFSLGEWFKKKK